LLSPQPEEREKAMKAGTWACPVEAGQGNIPV